MTGDERGGEDYVQANLSEIDNVFFVGLMQPVGAIMPIAPREVFHFHRPKTLIAIAKSGETLRSHRVGEELGTSREGEMRPAIPEIARCGHS